MMGYIFSFPPNSASLSNPWDLKGAALLMELVVEVSEEMEEVAHVLVRDLVKHVYKRHHLGSRSSYSLRIRS